MITIVDGWAYVTKQGRAIPIQRVNEETFFHALRAYGAREAAAAAAAKGLITISMKGKS